MLVPNGLFARRLPIAMTVSNTSEVDGFSWRRFDLLAIKRLIWQSWFGCSFI